jgi:hypothetical protein
MRTTVDIPDPVYRELKSRAALEGKTVKELILRGVCVTLRSSGVSAPTPRRGLKLPRIKAKNPGSLKLGKEGVYEYIPFP